jgi:hypothetical protein
MVFQKAVPFLFLKIPTNHRPETSDTKRFFLNFSTLSYYKETVYAVQKYKKLKAEINKTI